MSQMSDENDGYGEYEDSDQGNSQDYNYPEEEKEVLPDIPFTKKVLFL